MPPRNNPEIDQVVIVGLGLMGGSIAKDIRHRMPDTAIYAIDPSEAALQQAEADNIIDGAIGYEDVGRVACFVVIATPIEAVVPAAKKVAAGARKNPGKVIAIDVASVKAGIVDEFASLTKGNVEFLGTHPMAGTEFTGFGHARKDLFQAKPWMICKHPKNSDEAIETTKDLIHALGGRIREMDPKEHDRTVALVSHAVIMVSNYLFDFVATTEPDALEFAGDGFTSTTRLASGNPELHESILDHNYDATHHQLQKFAAYLTKRVKDGLVPSDTFFKDNVKRRGRWLHRRK